MDLVNIKSNIDKYVQSKMEELWEISKYIHQNPELAFNEHKACKIQVDYLNKYGFQLESPIGTLETAFKATFSNSKSNDAPTIAIVSEYDALPIGHACGHNLISTSALGAAIALKDAMINNEQLRGNLVVIGTPAEEGGGGKITLLRNNVFDNIDVVIMMHPTSDTHRLAGACLSSNRFEIEFIGKSAHSASHPDNGINALSAANLFLTAIAFLRQHFKSDYRVSAIIKDGGEAVGLIPDKVVVLGSMGAFSLTDLDIIKERVNNCAQGAALALGCSVNIKINEGYQGRIPNQVLSDICKKELIDIGEDVMDGLPIDYGGEDLGNVSRFIPICNPYISIFKDYKISNHTEQFKQLAISKAGYDCIEVSSKIMARTAVEILANTFYIEKAKEELKNRLKED